VGACRWFRAARVAAGAVALVSCGGSDPVTILQIVEEAPGVISFATSCAENVEVTVEESADLVAVVDVVGDSIDGDCGGFATVELDRPIGDRSILVGNDEWQVLADCEVVVAVPSNRANSECPDGT
jgi:adenosine/AMP kinase